MKLRKIIVLYFMALVAAIGVSFAFGFKGKFHSDPGEAVKEITKKIDSAEKNMGKGSEKKAKEEQDLKQYLNTKDKSGKTPIFYILDVGDKSLLDKAIKYGADLNICVTETQEPVLFYAIEQGKCDREIIEKLIVNGANCDALWTGKYSEYSDLTSMTAILWALIWEKDADILQLLLEKCIDCDVVSEIKFINENREWTTEKYTPLGYLSYYYADEEEYYSIFENLIKKKVDLEKKVVIDDLKITPLQAMCVLSNSKKLIKLLVDNGASVNGYCSFEGDSYTVLYFVCSYEDKELFDIILEKTDKATVDQLITVEGSKFSVVSYLLKYYDQNNVFYKHAFDRLLEKNPDLNIPYEDEEGNKFTPLYLATKADLRGKEDICERLLKGGANPNLFCLDKDYLEFDITPFHLAARENNAVLYKLFKENGGDKNLQDGSGQSPIDYKGKLITNVADKLDFYYDNNKNFDDFLSQEEVGGWEGLKKQVAAKTTGKPSLNMAQVAILYDDASTAKKLLDTYIKWDEKNSIGDNSLDFAIENNCDEVIRHIASKNVGIGNSIFKVIDKTMKDGDVALLEKFLSAGDYRTVETRCGENGSLVDPFIYASIKDFGEGTSVQKRLNVIKTLWDSKKQFSKKGLNSAITTDKKSPVLCAEDEAIILELVKYGADIEQTDIHGNNAKDNAFVKNQTAAISYLLDSKTKLGNSLFSAIENEIRGNDSHLKEFVNNESVSKIAKLVKTIYSDNSVIKCGPVVYTCLFQKGEKKSQSRINILSELLDCGLSLEETVNGGEYNGNTALQFAIMNDDYDLTKYLLEKGADVYSVSKGSATNGRTPLFYALEGKNEKIIDLLLNKIGGKLIDIQLKNSADKNATLLMFIARYGNFTTFCNYVPDMVMENPSILERTDSEGKTPFLYAAAYNSDPYMLKLFRMYGANVFAKDHNGLDAYDLAKINGNDIKVMERLESYGVYSK